MERPAEVSVGTPGAVLLAATVAIFAGSGLLGCAGPGAQADSSEKSGREPPPEVADPSTEDRPNSARTVQPRVEVGFDARRSGGVDVSGQEAIVERRVQRCYTRRVYGGELQSEGSMVYELVVTRNGHVAGTDRVSTDLRDDGLARCVERALSRLRFEIRSPDEPVYRFVVRFEFRLETMVPAEPPV